MQHYFLIKNNDQFQLQESDIHHIKHVMRMKSHDQMIGIYEGKHYLCEIVLQKEDVYINVIKILDKQTKLAKKVILCQAVIKNDKFDFVVQKACELGADVLIPILFRYSVVKVDGKEQAKLQRYEKISKEACEQSQRTSKMEIQNYLSVKDLKIKENTLAIMAYENEKNSQSFSDVLRDLEKYDAILLLIGPEGGFSSDEVKYLQQQGFHSVSFGSRILRSETAALYGLSVISYMLEGGKCGK